MIKTSQTSLIESEILRLVDNGETDITKIYSAVVEKFGVPRATVRRTRKVLVDRLKDQIEVLDTSEGVKVEN